MLRNRTTTLANGLSRQSSLCSSSHRRVSTLVSSHGSRCTRVGQGSNGRKFALRKTALICGRRCYSQNPSQGQAGQDSASTARQKEDTPKGEDSAPESNKESDVVHLPGPASWSPPGLSSSSVESSISASRSHESVEDNNSARSSSSSLHIPNPPSSPEVPEPQKPALVDFTTESMPKYSTSSSSSSSSPSHNISSQAEEQLTQSLEKLDLGSIKQRLREWTEQTAITIRTRADDFTATTKTTFSQLGTHLNKATGYEEIEALKKSVVEQEIKLQETRDAALQAKVTYAQAVIQRSNSQREVNDLLQRKSHWTDHDVGRFTTLVRQDHLYEQEETRAKQNVDESETKVEKEFSQLMRMILARYHEEQIWSDKIRSASTYGSLAVLALNLVVFVTAILFVEPWKRKRLAQTFEKKVDELSKENAERLDMSIQEIAKHLKAQENNLGAVVQEVKESLESLVREEVEKAPKRRTTMATPRTSSPKYEVVPLTQPEQHQPRPVVTEDLKPTQSVPSQRVMELGLVGAGALMLGIISTFWLGR